MSSNSSASCFRSTISPLPPRRPRPSLGLGAVLIGSEEESLVLDVIRRKEPFRYYGQAVETPDMAATLEKEFAAMMGTKYALAVTSGTAALECALAALGVGPGDEVILPAWSWISCFTAIVRVGALPVLAEIDESFCLAPGEITRLKTPDTKAVLIVHYQGVAADMEPLLQEAETAGIQVLEDCAQSPGAIYRGRRVGSMGAIGTYSFQYQKSMTSGEGGMVVTDDPVLYERAVRMHDLGQVRPYFKQFIEPQGPEFCGSQYRITEMQAALALAQLRKLDGIRAHCRALQDRILSQIRQLPDLVLRHVPDPEGDSGFEIYLCLPSRETADTFRDRLDALNVNCQKTTGTYCHYAHEYCRLRQAHATSASPFQKFEQWPAEGYRAEDFPITEDLAARFVAIPLGVLYTLEDADYIAACVCHTYLNVLQEV